MGRGDFVPHAGWETELAVVQDRCLIRGSRCWVGSSGGDGSAWSRSGRAGGGVCAGGGDFGGGASAWAAAGAGVQVAASGGTRCDRHSRGIGAAVVRRRRGRGGRRAEAAPAEFSVPVPAQALPAKTEPWPVRRTGVIESISAVGGACGSTVLLMRMRSGEFWMCWPGDHSGSGRRPGMARDRAHGYAQGV